MAAEVEIVQLAMTKREAVWLANSLALAQLILSGIEPGESYARLIREMVGVAPDEVSALSERFNALLSAVGIEPVVSEWVYRG